MNAADASQRPFDLERAILQALCQASLPDALRESVSRELTTHKWQGEDHRIVFDALRRIRRTRTSSWREQLPAQVARMGFPDIDWAIFFEPGETIPDIEKLVSDLEAAVKSPEKD
jgi:hypothetical protein